MFLLKGNMDNVFVNMNIRKSLFGMFFVTDASNKR